MSKVKKGNIWASSISIVFIVICVIALSIYNSDINKFKRTYGFGLGQSAVIVYYDSRIGWMGEGERYVQVSMSSGDLALFRKSLGTKDPFPYGQYFDNPNERFDELIQEYFSEYETDYKVDWNHEVEVILIDDNLIYVFDYTDNLFYVIEFVM